jgi:hypothetical protein
MNVPKRLWIYHIIHVDDFASVVQADGLFAPSTPKQTKPPISLSNPEIEERRLKQLTLTSYPDLCVGDCVSFAFCPRSVNLLYIHNRHPKLTYRDGQQSIIHLAADFHATVEWANQNDLRWVFTSSSASSYYFADFCDLKKLEIINWKAIESIFEKRFKDTKQAEFLLEKRLPLSLVKGIGVFSEKEESQIKGLLENSGHQPPVKIMPQWYY